MLAAVATAVVHKRHAMPPRLGAPNEVRRPRRKRSVFRFGIEDAQ